MSHADYEGDRPLSSRWSTLLPREDSRGTRASISRRLDSLEKGICGRIPSPEEIVQMCDDSLESTMSYEVLDDLETTTQTTLILLIHASINTGYFGWLKDMSLHYRLRLLDIAPHRILNEDARQLRRAIYSSTITTLKSAVASAWFRNAAFMGKPLEPLTHCEPTLRMSKVGGLCKDSGSAMMRKLFYIATAYTVPSNRNYASSPDRCEDTECSHINCQLYYTSPN